MIRPVYNISPRENLPQNFKGNLFFGFFPALKKKNKDDSFEKKVSQNDGAGCRISLKEQRKIARDLSLKMPDNIGSVADFYTIKGYGIKKMDKNACHILKREDEALKYLSSNGVSNIPKSRGIFFEDMEACLVTDIKPGKTLREAHLSKENFENLFKVFF